MIVDDIIRSLRDSSVVIADITPDNPNVYYEVGYAHALGTPTILLSDRTRSRLPFDVSGLRTIFYNNTIAGKRDVEEALTRHLTTLGDRWTSSAGRL
jgi:nucleoside 2-deoxyribosyltransferase